MSKKPSQFSEGKWSLNNVARSIVHLYGKKYFHSILTPYVKIDWKWIIDLNVKKQLLEFKKANTKKGLTQKGRTIFLTLE